MAFWLVKRTKERNWRKGKMKMFRKKCLIATILLFTLNTMSIAELSKVSRIDIKGNLNIKEKVIRKAIKTKAGEYYSSENLKTDLNNVLALGYFDDVTVEVDTNTYVVTFAILEKIYVKKIDFKGNKKFGKGMLKEEIAVKEKEYLDKSQIEPDIMKILDKYGDAGYADTKIVHELSMDKTKNQATLTFFVTEGRKVTVEKIEISGTRKYKPKKIVKLMETKRKKKYLSKVLNEDLVKIENFYKNNGFESVEVSSPTITFNEERTKATININVIEGPKYKIANITFSGHSIYTEKELRKDIILKSKQIYKKENIELTQSLLAELYSDKGYLRAEIVPKYTKYPEQGLIDVNFNITENNLIYLGKIYIDGLITTKEYVIRREVLLKEGDPFSGVKLRRSVEKIYNLGFIDEAKVDIQPSNTGDTADLVLGITEGKPGMLQAGAGYSSVDKLVGTLQVNHMNLFGRAQRLNLLWEFGDRRKNYEIGWTEPWFLGKKISLGLSLYDLTRQEYINNNFAYSSHKQGSEIRVGPRITDYLSLQFIYGYDKQQIYDVQVDPTTNNTYISPVLELTSSFTGQLIYDSRDNIFDPSRGSKNSLSLQLAGCDFKGDVHFLKPVVRSSWFIPTFWKFVFSANAVVGYVEALRDYNLQSNYKFFSGGPDSIRGYSYNELGPPNGGEVMIVTNFEYKFPIVQENRRTILQGAFFYDVGGAWASYRDVKFIIGETEQWRTNAGWDNYMKSGWGFGIRFTTPVFPIRLDWGWPVQVKNGRNPPEFYFSIGQIF
ncbi:MAG: outer membrane protein assembly factor BamA [Elusimicrobia bacterium RIFOXYA2_FULL_39_19]|nr:MAG: outer membrane protein assembly factor BamA [Elusimicrobia bacterium RIFOXYA2_FULL_39_19]